MCRSLPLRDRRLRISQVEFVELWINYHTKWQISREIRTNLKQICFCNKTLKSNNKRILQWSEEVPRRPNSQSEFLISQNRTTTAKCLNHQACYLFWTIRTSQTMSSTCPTFKDSKLQKVRLRQHLFLKWWIWEAGNRTKSLCLNLTKIPRPPPRKIYSLPIWWLSLMSKINSC